MLEAAPPAFSFVFGVPDAALLDALRERGIVTLGTATTPRRSRRARRRGRRRDRRLGRRGRRASRSVPRAAEDSLVGTLPLVRSVAAEVRAPVIAAGGIADGRGIAAALALGAEGVQIGSAFLATQESGTTPEHRAACSAGPADAADAGVQRPPRARDPQPAHGGAQRRRRHRALPYQNFLLAPILPPRAGPHRPGRPVGRPGLPAHHASPRRRALRRAGARDRRLLSPTRPKEPP